MATQQNNSKIPDEALDANEAAHFAYNKLVHYERLNKDCFDGKPFPTPFFFDEVCHWSPPLSDNPEIAKFMQPSKDQNGLFDLFKDENGSNEK